MHCNIKAQLASPVGKIEIRDYYWPEPLDSTFCDRTPAFGLSLSSVPKASRARFLGSRSPDYQRVGRLVFRPSGVPMHCLNDGGRQRIVLFQHEGTANVLFDRLDDLDPDSDLQHQGIIETFRRIAVEAASPGFASAALTEALITAAVIELLRLNQKSVAVRQMKGGLADWQLRRIDEALNDIDGSAPSVADLAALVGVSPRHLQRCLGISRGSSASHYIARARFSKACDLLLSSDLMLKQIAHRCGFASASHFTNAFQREAGMSPRQYRSMNRSSLSSSRQ